MRHPGKQGGFIVIALAISFVAWAGAGPARAQSSATPGKQLTVERIYTRPSLSGALTQGLEWAPDGKRLSYFHRSGEGTDAKTELWVMDAATGEHRVLVDAERLDTLLVPPKGEPSQRTGLGRLPARNYFWSPSGHALLFVGGGRLIWLDLKTMEAKQLFRAEKDVEDPKISPDGRWVGYVQEHNLWVVSVSGGMPKQITRGGNEDFLEGELDWVYPEELELGTAYWWSPDSSRIAFLEMDERKVTQYPLVNYLSYTGETNTMRYPKTGDANPVVRVGVVGVDGGKAQWITSGSNTDVYLARVNWLPDSKRLAIQRLNRVQNQLDLLFADTASGVSRVILTERDKYWINLSDDLHFLANGQRFLWSSERSGFRHLYLYDAGGRLIEQLTQGDWQISGIPGFGPGAASGLVVDEGHGYAYFLSGKDNPTQTQLYRVSLSDKSINQVTKDPGTHLVSMAPGAQFFVDTYSNAMTPPRQDIYRADGTRGATVNENKTDELAEYRLSPVEFLNVDADDGTKLYAMMIKPPNFDALRKYPVLINVYGGPHAQLVRDSWGGSNFLWHQMMAQKGYILFTLDNRGMWGRGHSFETAISRHFGKVELQDQLAGVRYLKSLPYVDASRIGIWGWSYGGFMTINAMLNASDVFKAGFAGGPVTDWRQYDTIYTERYMGRPQDNPDGYKDSSPVTHAANLKGKLLIAHATGDDNVHFANTVEFVEKLIQADKYAEVSIYPGRGHGVSDPPARIQLFQRVTQFFLDNL